MEVIPTGFSLMQPLHGLLWVQTELSAEKEDTDAVVFEGAKAARAGFDGLDFGVEPFGHRVGDGMA